MLEDASCFIYLLVCLVDRTTMVHGSVQRKSFCVRVKVYSRVSRNAFGKKISSTAHAWMLWHTAHHSWAVVDPLSITHCPNSTTGWKGIAYQGRSSNTTLYLLGSRTTVLAYSLVSIFSSDGTKVWQSWIECDKGVPDLMELRDIFSQ